MLKVDRGPVGLEAAPADKEARQKIVIPLMVDAAANTNSVNFQTTTLDSTADTPHANRVVVSRDIARLNDAIPASRYADASVSKTARGTSGHDTIRDDDRLISV
jgi:hypothetical protein